MGIELLEARTLKMSDDCFVQLRNLVQGRLGIKVPDSKRVMLESRLLKRLRILGLDSFDHYASLLDESSRDDGEMSRFIDAVTTNKTEFFREADHFAYLQDTALDEVLDIYGEGRLNIWSAASSSGEEAYTLLMAMETFRRRRPMDYYILATDVSEKMVDRGRRGVYNESSLASVPEELRPSFFRRSRLKQPLSYRVKPEYRQKVRFRRLNLMDETYPLERLYHVIFCRNVLIYFERETQARVLEKLYSRLAPGGFLFLGHSESLAGLSMPLENRSSAVYRKPL